MVCGPMLVSIFPSLLTCVVAAPFVVFALFRLAGIAGFGLSDLDFNFGGPLSSLVLGFGPLLIVNIVVTIKCVQCTYKYLSNMVVVAMI